MKLNSIQLEMVKAFESKVLRSTTSSRGILCAPTGTGKTGVARAIFNLFGQVLLGQKRVKRQVKGVSLFLTPRIGLTNQQANAITNFNIEDVEYLDVPLVTKIIHSGISHHSKEYTNLLNFVETQKGKGNYVVLVCTYQSASAFLKKFEFDSIVCDEAHYVVSKEFNSTVINDLDQNAIRIFMTATPKEIKGENTIGLNNSVMYGEYLKTISPSVAISRRLIVAPRLHIFNAFGDVDEENTIVSQVNHVYTYHRNFNTKIQAKVIFAMSGTADVDVIRQHATKIATANNCTVFSIISNDNCGFINGVSVSREELLDGINNCKTGAIICHYNILSEGLDVDGITGVCIMRNTSLITSVQTIGRALRIYHLDRQEDGYAKPIEDRVKQHALVTLVVYNGNTGMKEMVKPFVQAIRKSGFDFFKEDILISSPRHKGTDESGMGETMNDKEAEEPKLKYQVELDAIQSEIETDEELEAEIEWKNNANPDDLGW